MKRVLFALMIIVAVFSAAGAGSLAYFSDDESATANTFQVGTWGTVVGAGELYVTNPAPGASGTETWTAATSGTVPEYLDLENIQYAETGYGTIDEVFNHQLKAKMGEKIEWGAGGAGSDNFTSVKEGAITKQITKPNLVFRNLSVQELRKLSLIGLGVSFLVFCGLAILYWWKKPRLSFLGRELERNRKKYGELISEVSALPPTREGEVTIRASSSEALVNISNNSLKAILLKIEPDKYTYCVIDGLVRYEYVSELELPAKEERTEDEPGRRMVDDQR